MSKKRKQGLKKATCALIFVIYLVVLFYFLFFAESFGRTLESDTYHYNLTLFKEIMRYWNNRETLGFYSVFLNLAGNIGAFIPFGVLVPMLFPKKNSKFVIVLFEGFVFSIAVECVQLITKVGSFDVDDVLLNTIGVVIGFICYAVTHPRQKRKSKR